MNSVKPKEIHTLDSYF